MVVWHHDWRTPAALERMYQGYAYSDGKFFAKHLLRRDRDAFVLALGVLRRALGDAVRNLDYDPAEPSGERQCGTASCAGSSQAWSATTAQMNAASI